MEILKFILCIVFTFVICKSVLFCLKDKKDFNKNKNYF